MLSPSRCLHVSLFWQATKLLTECAAFILISFPVSPYLKSLSMVAANKLLHLLEVSACQSLPCVIKSVLSVGLCIWVKVMHVVMHVMHLDFGLLSCAQALLKTAKTKLTSIC